MSGLDDQRRADWLADRAWLKRRLVWWRSVALVLLTAVLLVGGDFLARGKWDGSFSGGASGPYIGRLTVSGVIRSDPDRFAAIEQMADDPNLAGVILRLDSPGGTYSGSEGLYQALETLAAAKPMVSVIDGTAASGAYMAAVAGEHIIARGGSITGSVGVIMHLPQVSGLLEKLGIEVDAIRSGDLKARPNPLEPLTEEASVAATAIVGDLFQQFADLVQARRDLTDTAYAQVATGRVFTGRQAIPLGLIDEIGGETAAKTWLETSHGLESSLPIHDIPAEKGQDAIRDLLRKIGSVALFDKATTLDGPWAIWHPGY